MDYFVGTERECKDYIVKLDVMMGYPNPATKTDTYAKPIPHDGKAGTFLVPIKSVWAPTLNRQAMLTDINAVGTVKEKLRTSRTKLKLENAFKTKLDLTHF